MLSLASSIRLGHFACFILHCRWCSHKWRVFICPAVLPWSRNCTLIFLWETPALRPCGLVGVSPHPNSGSHELAWPVSALYVPGHGESGQELTVTQAWPVNWALGLFWGLLGKKVSPAAVLNLKAHNTRASGSFYTTPWRKPARERGSHRRKQIPEVKRKHFFQPHFSTWI